MYKTVTNQSKVYFYVSIIWTGLEMSLP